MSTSSYRQAGRARGLVALVVVLLAAPLLFATPAGAAPPPGTPLMRQSAELVSIPLGTDRRQGSKVALSADGSTLAVAAEGGRVDSGYVPSAVVVYARHGDGWLTQTILRSPPEPENGYHTWAFDIAISADGDTLAVTNPRETVVVAGATVPAAGVIHLFTRSGLTWGAAGRVIATQPRAGGFFGRDVSVSGDGSRVAVTGNGGAYLADVGSRVVRELPLPTGVSRNVPSIAISPDGRRVVVGAPDGSMLPHLGEAFVLIDDPAVGWTQRWRLEAPPEQRGASFGQAVDVSDTGTVVVGAFGRAGGVSVFDRRGAALVRTARFVRPYATQFAGLGNSVAVSADGSTVVGGAPYRIAAGGSIELAGAAYRWVRSPGGWSWGGLLSVARPNDAEAQGQSTAVSADGRVVAVGAPGRSSARLGVTGAAMVYSAVP